MSVSKINFNDKNEAFLTVDSMEFIDKDELKEKVLKSIKAEALVQIITKK